MTGRLIRQMRAGRAAAIYGALHQARIIPGAAAVSIAIWHAALSSSGIGGAQFGPRLRYARPMNQPITDKYPETRALRTRSAPQTRDQFTIVWPLQSRWNDHDAFGYINNVAYYEYFDSTVNRLLIERGALDQRHGASIGVVVESHCEFFAPLAYPQPLQIGLRVGRVGATSVRYELAVFAEGAQHASAQGYVVHAYIDRLSRRPQPLHERLRLTVESLLLRGSD